MDWKEDGFEIGAMVAATAVSLWFVAFLITALI